MLCSLHHINLNIYITFNLWAPSISTSWASKWLLIHINLICTIVRIMGIKVVINIHIDVNICITFSTIASKWLLISLSINICTISFSTISFAISLRISLAPSRLAPSRLAPSRLAPSRSAPSRLAPSRLAPSRLASRLAPLV